MSIVDLKPDILVQGNLSEHPMIELLGLLFAFRKSGRLQVVQGRLETRIYCYNGLPINSAGNRPEQSLLDAMILDKSLAIEDVLQVKQLAADQGLPIEDCLKNLLEISESEIYYYRAKAAKEMIIKTCGFRAGKYTFAESEDVLYNLDMYDLNPLELIYEGMVRYHIANIAKELFQLELRTVKLNPEIRDFFLLPGPFYEHSHILDLFTREVGVARAIAILQQEFADINTAVYFLYLLMVTRLLVIPPEIPAEEIIEDVPSRGAMPEAPEEIVAAEEILRPPAPETSRPPSVRRRREVVREPRDPPPAPEISTAYIITRSRQKAAGIPSAEVETEKEKGDSSAAAERESPMSEAPAPAAARTGPAEADLRQKLLSQQMAADKALSRFEVLGITAETGVAEIQEAYLARKKIAEQVLAADYSLDLQALASRVRDRLEQAFLTLSEPEPRIEYERTLIAAEMERAWNLELRKTVARKMEVRGQWYLRHNAARFARECFGAAIELDPEEALYFMHLGWAIYRDRAAEAAEAREYLRSALKINPRLEKAYYYLGIIAKREGDPAAAEANFRQALELDPADQSARRELAFLSQSQKQKGFWHRIFGGA